MALHRNVVIWQSCQQIHLVKVLWKYLKTHTKFFIISILIMFLGLKFFYYLDCRISPLPCRPIGKKNPCKHRMSRKNKSCRVCLKLMLVIINIKRNMKFMKNTFC